MDQNEIYRLLKMDVLVFTNLHYSAVVPIIETAIPWFFPLNLDEFLLDMITCVEENILYVGKISIICWYILSKADDL